MTSVVPNSRPKDSELPADPATELTSRDQRLLEKQSGKGAASSSRGRELPADPTTEPPPRDPCRPQKRHRDEAASEGEHLLAVKMLSTSCQEKNHFLPKHIFSSQQTKIRTLTQKFPKIETDESFRVAVKRLSGGCHEAVGQKSSQF